MHDKLLFACSPHAVNLRENNIKIMNIVSFKQPRINDTQQINNVFIMLFALLNAHFLSKTAFVVHLNYDEKWPQG